MTAIAAHTIIGAACKSSVSPFKKRDASFQTVPVSIIKTMFEPFAALERVTRFTAETPLEEIPLQALSTAGTVGRVLERIAAATIFIVQKNAKLMLDIAVTHPEGKAMVQAGVLPWEALATTLWALAPVPSWDLGTCDVYSFQLI